MLKLGTTWFWLSRTTIWSNMAVWEKSAVAEDPDDHAKIINAAILGFESQKLRIDAQIAELRKMLTGTPTETAATPEAPRGKRRKMSAAARKRIGDAQRKRWAESKKESVPSSPVAPEAPKPKRKLSAAGKAAIVAALKKRWAAKRAAAEKAAKA
jgi:hypothetical protein